MANPNPQLEAALAQFAAQPGTTPDQQSQLRAAVVADADRLDLLNLQAAAGQIKGFALETAGGAPNLTGTYDKSAGVITVPATSFQPSGTVAGNDLKAALGLQAITVDFAHKTWQNPAGQTHTVNQDMVANLQSTLNGSPVLAAQIKAAVTHGHVQHFSLLGNSMAAGATYDGNTPQQDGSPKGINLPPPGLQTKTAANPQGKYDAQDMTFVLGHEIQHGFNDGAKDQATRMFVQGINTQAQVQGSMHDYTDELRAYIQAGREDEAKAEIAGWNALLSRERQIQPNASGPDMMLKTTNDRVNDFVSADPVTNLAVPKPGLTLNPDGSLSQTPVNIAAMGQHYFDRPSHVYPQPGQRPLGLGEHKPTPTADYTNYYGTWALERIVAAEDQANVRHQGARPQIAIDMASLGMKEDLIEMEGLDLGRNTTARAYLDTSQIPATQGHFHHTQDGSVHPQHDHQYVPIMSGSTPWISGGLEPEPSDRAHAAPTQQQVQTTSFVGQIFGRMHDAAATKDDKAMDAALKDYEQSPYGQQFLREIGMQETLWQAQERQAQLEAQVAEQQQQLERQQQMSVSGPARSL